MNLLTLVEMAATGLEGRTALGDAREGWSHQDLLDRAATGARVLRDAGAEELLYLGTNGGAFPVALLASAWAGIPFVPLNYRLGPEQMADLLGRHPRAAVVTDVDLPGLPDLRWTTEEWSALCPPAPGGAAAADRWEDDAEAVALLLYTSGTTSAPKAAVLRHRHLTSYLIGSVEFGSAAPEDAALVSVPPYHIAGVSNLLSNLYSGRRLVHLAQFDPGTWLDVVRAQGITHALLVPTMLARIVEHLGDTPAQVPTLRSLAYGGAKMPLPVLLRAVRLFPDVDFVNAYGLTETSSTIAVLGPEDHRAAFTDDPVAIARLGSVGRLLPGVEIEVRDEAGRPVGAGEYGDVHVRGPQISGEYRGLAAAVDPQGWFATRDRGAVDADGYLFIEGRSDDTIIRGGENIAPAEIEDTLLTHPAVLDVAVVGVPDEEWGQDVAAVVVLREGAAAGETELAAFVRERLRGSKTPRRIRFVDELPYTPTGKLLRRQVLADLTAQQP